MADPRSRESLNTKPRRLGTYRRLLGAKCDWLAGDPSVLGKVNEDPFIRDGLDDV